MKLPKLPYVQLIGTLCGLVYAGISGDHQLLGALTLAMVNLFQTAPHKVAAGE